MCVSVYRTDVLFTAYEGVRGPIIPNKRPPKLGEGILQPSCLTMNEANGPESADAAVEESTAADPKISTKEELEVINLSFDPNVYKPVSISTSLSVEERAHLV